MAIFFFNMLSRLVLAPLLPIVEKELGLTHTLSGSLFMMIAIGYSLGLFGSGFLSARLTHRKTIAVASVGVGCAILLIILSKSVWLIGLGLVSLGITAGFYLPSGLTTLTSSFANINWGKVIGVHEFAPAFAFLTAPVIVEGLFALCNWRGILILIGGASVLMGVLFLRFSPAGDFTGQAPTFDAIRVLSRKFSFWIMVVLFSLMLGAGIGLYNMLPLYLVAERGINRELANTLLALSRLPLLLMAPFAGWITDRFGPKPTMATALLICGLMTVILGVVPGRWVLLAAFLQPMMTIWFFPAGFTVLSRIVPPQARNLSISMTTLIAYTIGAGLVPTFLGIFADAGFFSMAVIILGGLVMAGTALVGRLHLQASPGIAEM
ncbi:MAG: MFS transporter [Syntrophales bacterium]|nr:MFS transporter [Syntrophales bacterium]